MKLAIRIFALSVVFAGFAAASLSSATTKTISNHRSAISGLPVPACGPYVLTCPANGY